jgi:hypothetical protein
MAQREREGVGSGLNKRENGMNVIVELLVFLMNAIIGLVSIVLMIVFFPLVIIWKGFLRDIVFGKDPHK